MVETLVGKPYFLFHTLFGYHHQAFYKIMLRAGRERYEFSKIDSFLNASNSSEGIELSLGLDLREIMCTVSKLSPAVTYHRPYGLILDGSVHTYYDNDTGKVLKESGEYSEGIFEFTKEVTLPYLLGEWYESFIKAKRFVWNEVVLHKGSKVIGAFYDPRFNPASMEFDAASPHKEREFDLFINKAQKCGLSLVPITAKFLI